MDAGAKVVVCLSAMAATFSSGGFPAAAAPWPLLAAGILASGVGFPRFWRGVRPFLWFMGLALLAHGLSTPGRSLAPFPLAGVDWTVEGTVRGATAALRVATAAGYSTLLALTTDPVDLVRAMERGFAPLERLGFGVRDFCLALVVALRCLPRLGRDLGRLRVSARRGGSTLEGRLRFPRRFAEGIGPLIAASLERAERAAVRARRERDREAPAGKFGRADWTALALAAGTLVLAFSVSAPPGAP
jgi:energy-coupling factor transporter transmembrane protein EcfT